MSSVSLKQAQQFLRSHLSADPQQLTLIGEGAWSRCFGYLVEDREYAIRFGRYIEDFQKDCWAARFSSAELPIPEVFEVGEIQDGYFAISRRAHGIPLEQVSIEVWQGIIPDLVNALEALRTVDLKEASGVGHWDKDGTAKFDTWSEYLLDVEGDKPTQRTHGWRRKLEQNYPSGMVAFERGLDNLKEFALANVPRSLLHCDLMNRNALVSGGHINAVFDWGCGRFGDHLYDLAWFEFWAPWHTNLDIPLFRKALEDRWSQIGDTPKNLTERLNACYLHIGLDHIAYNAYTENWRVLQETADRMRELVNLPIQSGLLERMVDSSSQKLRL